MVRASSMEALRVFLLKWEEQPHLVLSQPALGLCPSWVTCCQGVLGKVTSSLRASVLKLEDRANTGREDRRHCMLSSRRCVEYSHWAIVTTAHRPRLGCFCVSVSPLLSGLGDTPVCLPCVLILAGATWSSLFRRSCLGLAGEE